MQVKRYRAPTIREATDKVKRMLGPEALIVSTQKIEASGGGPLFEVAAVPATAKASAAQGQPFRKIRSELLRIKEMIFLLNRSEALMEEVMANSALLRMYVKLIRCGVRERYVRVFLQRAGALKAQAESQGAGAWERVVREIMRVVRVEDPLGLGEEKRAIAAFVGTTGVGKTTTIAKLAARLMLQSGKRVGLISLDSYRVGGMEQLQTYAHILGVPCLPAFNRKDLFTALRRLESRDAVLIDTAGQSQYDGERVQELRRMTRGEPEIRFHLLLSVPTRESEMSRTALSFAPLHCHSYIFTKVDEAQRFGAVINHLMTANLPISYITTGQNVPEDIEKAEKGRILRLLLSKN